MHGHCEDLDSTLDSRFCLGQLGKEKKQKAPRPEKKESVLFADTKLTYQKAFKIEPKTEKHADQSYRVQG